MHTAAAPEQMLRDADDSSSTAVESACTLVDTLLLLPLSLLSMPLLLLLLVPLLLLLLLELVFTVLLPLLLPRVGGSLLLITILCLVRLRLVRLIPRIRES